MHDFVEFINCNEEFAFYYNGKQYEIVMIYGISLFLCDTTPHGTLLNSFKDKNDFWENCRIEGKRILEIIHEIIIP